MPPARPRGPTFLEFLLKVIEDDDRVRRLVLLIVATGLVVCAILSVYYVGTQHLPLWSKIAMPSGGFGVSTLCGVFLRQRNRPDGTTLLGQRRSAGEIPQGPEDGEHPHDDSGEQ